MLSNFPRFCLMPSSLLVGVSGVRLLICLVADLRRRRLVAVRNSRGGSTGYCFGVPKHLWREFFSLPPFWPPSWIYYLLEVSRRPVRLLYCYHYYSFYLHSYTGFNEIQINTRICVVFSCWHIVDKNPTIQIAILYTDSLWSLIQFLFTTFGETSSLDPWY